MFYKRTIFSMDLCGKTGGVGLGMEPRFKPRGGGATLKVSLSTFISVIFSKKNFEDF